MTVPEPTFKRYALTFLRNLFVAMFIVIAITAFGPFEFASPAWTFGILLPVIVACALLAYAGLLGGDKANWHNHMVEAEALVDEHARKASQRAEEDAKEIADRARIEVERAQEEVEIAEEQAEEIVERARRQEAFYRNALMKRGGGLPTVVGMLEELDARQDEVVSRWMTMKAYPAPKAADLVQDHAQRRRTAERERRVAQSIVEYYESAAPFLVDLKEELFGDGADEVQVDLTPFTPEEREDPLTHYLTIDEYRNLSPAEKSQFALDRFWKRHKSKRLIGKLYERYVGYLYEEDGYEVEYVGIIQGFEDLGRDLICRKGDEVVVVQCKNWSQFKTIYEKHIFQFFGTVFEYRDKNPDKDVRAVFYTTTTLSDLARRFSNELDIELVEGHEFDQAYPSIKCNVSRSSREKIYHLPFDQQYDNVRIEPDRGEFYCRTVADAEKAGFRRAFRYQGLKGDTG